LEVAAACLQFNSQERLKPVLQAFGILGSTGQQQFNFEEDSSEEDSDNDEEDSHDD
jgi:guanylate kinase